MSFLYWLESIRCPFLDAVMQAFTCFGEELAFLLLAVLAATSFDRAIRGLGGKRWRALHRAVYAVAILAVLHFYWMRAGKNDFAEVLVYGVLLAMLLGWRVWHQWRGRRIEAAQRHAVSAH